MDELSEEDKLVVSPCTSCTTFLISTIPCCRSIYRLERCVCTYRGYNQRIQNDHGWEVDEYPEAAFNLVGTIEDAIEKGKKLFEQAKG